MKTIANTRARRHPRRRRVLIVNGVDGDTLVAGVRKVLSGQRVLSRSVAARLREKACECSDHF